MKYVFLRFGQVGIPGHVGFITDKFGSLVTADTIEEALDFIDYSKMDSIAAIHFEAFRPTAYEIEALDDRHMMEILRDTMSDEKHRFHRKHLACGVGTVYVILFPEGKDPFKNAVLAEKLPARNHVVKTKDALHK